MKVLRGRYLGVVLGASGLMAASASAQTPCPPCLHDQVLQSLPADVEAVVAVSNAAKQRTSVAGRALTAMIAKSGSWGETTRAWGLLARTLDWTPEKTFDELLGRRVSLVMREVGAAEGAQWSLLTEVSGDTQKRLRERLKAAPRGAVAGLSVLSIEDGSFEFVVSPEGEGAVVLLAPRKSEGMLDELVPVLRARPAQGAVAAAPKSCDVVVVWRGGEGKSVTITAGAVDAGWDATFVCSRDILFQGEMKQPARKWSDSLFKQLESGSLAAVMSVAGQELSVPGMPAEWSGVVTQVMGTGEPGMRVGAFVRSAAPPPVARGTAALVSSTPRNVGAPAQKENGARLCTVVMTEAPELQGAMVKGDRAMARCAQTLLNGKPEAAAGCEVQLEVVDRGPRVLKFGGEGLSVHPDLEPVVCRAFGDSMVLSWNTVRSGRGAWCIASMSPEAAEAGGRETRAVTAPESGIVKARLSMGMVRPAALSRWMDVLEPGMAAEGSEFVDSLRWDVWMREDGQVEGAVSVRMVGPGAK